MSDRDLIPGRFYWAIPVFDVYFDGAWFSGVQPARYVGEDKWQWIATEDEEWPARWAGDEIIDPNAGSNTV